MKEYNIQQSIAAQKSYCTNEKVPHFAPHSGNCYRCNKNIYAEIKHERKDWKTNEVIGEYSTGIDVKTAGTELITGCPHCSRSYCD